MHALVAGGGGFIGDWIISDLFIIRHPSLDQDELENLP